MRATAERCFRRAQTKISGNLESLIDFFSRSGLEAPHEQATALSCIWSFQSCDLRSMRGAGEAAEESKCVTNTARKISFFRRGEAIPCKLRPLSQPAGRDFSARSSCGRPANARKSHVEW